MVIALLVIVVLLYLLVWLVTDPIKPVYRPLYSPRCPKCDGCIEPPHSGCTCDLA